MGRQGPKRRRLLRRLGHYRLRLLAFFGGRRGVDAEDAALAGVADDVGAVFLHDHLAEERAVLAGGAFFGGIRSNSGRD